MHRYLKMRDMPKEILRTMGKRLKMLRESVGLSQAELAARIDKPKQSVASWEIGHRTPDFIVVLKIAAALGKDVDDFTVVPDDSMIPKKRRLGRPPNKPKPADDTITDDDDAK